jgi:hypothetical protein
MEPYGKKRRGREEVFRYAFPTSPIDISWLTDSHPLLLEESRDYIQRVGFIDLVHSFLVQCIVSFQTNVSFVRVAATRA